MSSVKNCVIGGGGVAEKDQNTHNPLSPFSPPQDTHPLSVLVLLS